MTDKPIMPWDSAEPFAGDVVWWTRMDQRYQIEVQRKGDYEATLFIWDHANEDERVFGRAVALQYGAMFGPDMDDIALWQSIAIEFVDAQLSEEKS